MIRRIFLLTIVVLFAQFGFGQQSIAKMVEDKKLTGAKFVSFASLKEDNAPSELKSQAALNIAKFSILDIDNKSISQVLENKPEALTMSVPSSVTGNMELELVKVNLYTSDFAVTTDKNQRFKASDKEVHYRGIIKGNEKSIVAISIFEDKIMGLIGTTEGNFVLGEMQGDNDRHQHVLYNDRDLKFKTSFNCATVDDPNLKYTKDQLFKAPPQPTSFGPGANSCVRIYVETDYNVFTTLGSVANVNNFIAGLFNQSAMLYQNEGVFMVMSQLLVLTAPSGYNPSNTGNYLASFQSLRNAFNGDLGHLVGFYNIGGQAAGFAGLCNANRDLDQCVSGLTVPPYPTIPTYSFNVEVFTHEMGHLLGSRHTHACVWNGNSTAIDGCAGGTEGGCPLPPNPPGGGTIMSYCHIQPVGINFLLGFGPQPSNVIRNRIYNRTCLNACAGNTPRVDLYIKDKSTDTGVEPNPDPTGEFWVSQDIWIRRLNDGGTAHENPRGGFTNYVYVRVRNRGNAPSFSMSNVRLRAYWAKASGALGWPNPFSGGITGCTPPVSMGNTLGNVQIPAIPAGGSVVLVFPWVAPTPAGYSCFGSDRFHFCLLGRIETSSYSPFGMSYPETSNLWLNVKNNNNIAWKNVSVTNPNGTFNRFANPTANAEEPEENGTATFTLAGDKQTGIKSNDAALLFTFEKGREVAAPVILKQTAPSGQVPSGQEPTDVTEFDDVIPTPYKAINRAENIWDFATVDIDMGMFFKKWSGKGEFIKILDEAAPSGYPWVRLLQPKASITGINIESGDVGAVAVRTQQTKVATEDNNQFDFDVTLLGNEGVQIGGETFLINLGTRDAAAKTSNAAEAKKAAATDEVSRVTVAQGAVNVYMKKSNVTYEASLHDLSGKLLQTKIFAGTTTISNDRLPKGIYVLSLVNTVTKEVSKRRVRVE
jgi:hypothetical protein